MISIGNIETFVLRVPLEKPVRSAVGVYDNRPGVFVKIEDTNGVCGWGEAFCNFPPCGAEHRARLIDTVLKPLLLAHDPFSNPQEAYSYLTQKTTIIVLKSGEFGPFAQCIAAIDIALWDLWARVNKIPIWKLLNPDGNPEIRVYASGLGPDNPEKTAVQKQLEGYTAFKLKVGFEGGIDEKNLHNLRMALDNDALIMIDANQVWSLEEAVSKIESFEKYNLHWIEEPIRCDCSLEEWQQLADFSPIDLASGENLLGEESCSQFIENSGVRFIQPDIIKWGGYSGLLPLIELSSKANVTYCPHTFAGGIGLIASAHLLAASQSPGLLEIDANDNPLRTEIIEPFPQTTVGKIILPDKPGLGWEPNIENVLKFRVQ